MIPDYAKTVKAALAAASFPATLEVDDDFRPTAGAPVLLVADDGGPAMLPGAWLAGKSPRRTVLRLTAFAAGRTESRTTVVDAAQWVFTNRPGIARVEDMPGPLITRDPKTRAYLAWVTMPVIVRSAP